MSYDDFRDGYIAAALFSTSAMLPDEDENDDRSFTDLGMDETDMAPSTLAAIERDCRAFYDLNHRLIASCEETHTPGSPDDTVWNHAGRDFWYTREGHGVGFWDGDWPDEAGEILTKATKRFGQGAWYTGDDGMIYQFGAEA